MDTRNNLTGRQIRLRNVVRNQKYLHYQVNRIAMEEPGAESLSHIRNHLQNWVSSIEAILSRRSARPWNLATPSRRAYALFRFLLEEERLEGHVDTVRRFHHQFRKRPNASTGELLHVELGNGGYVYSYRKKGNTHYFHLSEGFIAANDKVLANLVTLMTGRATDRLKRLITLYQESDSYVNVVAELIWTAEPRSYETRGAVYDLDEIFESVNRRFLAGTVSKPKLCWSTTPTFRKFGHYRFLDDELMISSTLDAPGIPRFVIEFVMYHELLHKKHKYVLRGHRRIYHSSAFRADESRFPRQKKADAFLEELSKRADFQGS